MPAKKLSIDKFLSFIEKTGNKLPHPGTLFIIFAIAIIILSYIGSILDWSAVNTINGDVLHVENLLCLSGLQRILSEMVPNFIGFAPLGVVLVAMLGIGICEVSGLLSALIRKFLINSPAIILTPAVIFLGVFSQIGADVGYVLLIPLAGLVFAAVGRHPFIGLSAGFAGVSGGFGANIILGPNDSVLAGLSQEAASIVSSGYQVSAAANYYFQCAATLVIVIVGTIVTEKIIAPHFSKYNDEFKMEKVDKLKPSEEKALLWVGFATLISVAVILLGIIPDNGFLRSSTGGVLDSVLLKSIAAFIFVIGAFLGIVYGFVSGKFKNDSDVMNAMSESIKSLGIFLVMVFFAAQFIAYFKWSNLGGIIAIHGARLIESMNVGIIPLIISFVLFVAVLNILIGSMGAKWALLSPIFVPLFMHLGYSPELVQGAYRVGDGATNMISPMMFYLALIIAYYQKYDKKAKYGTIISMMLPYTIAFLISLSILLIIWILLGIPLGPGSTINLVV